MKGKTYKTSMAINLSDSNRKERSIGYNWEIVIEPRRKNFFQRIFSPRTDEIVKPVKLDIVNLVVPAPLKYKGSLLTVCKGSCLVDQDRLPYEMTLDSLSTTFSVFLNAQSILDYTEPFDLTPTVAEISFDLVCCDLQNIIIDSTHVVLEIELTKIECEPKIELMLDEEVQYDSQCDEYYIGDLIIESTAELEYAAPVTIKGMVSATLDKVSANQFLVIKKEDTIVNDITTGALSRNEVIIYSLFVKMGEMKNPMSDRSQFNIRFSGIYHIGSSIDNKHLNVCEESVDILQDPQGTELVVTMDLSDGLRVKNNDEIVRPEYSFFALSNTLNQINIYLGNLAKDTSHRQAGLRILNLGLATEITSGVTVYDASGRAVDVSTSSIFKVDCQHQDINNAEGVFIANGNEPPIELQLLFSPLEIAKVGGTRDFHFTMEAKITFEYYENRFGIHDFTQIERKTFTMTIVQPLFLQPNPQWLCVDYGSSAIVCLYKNEIIDLYARKKEIMVKAIKEERMRQDNFESGSKFLSSDIVLHTISANSQVSSMATEHRDITLENYGNLAVFLSPTSALYTAESLRLLPCLKLLVGNTWLPQNKYLENYSYKRLKNGVLTSVVAKEDRSNESSLLRVDQVFLQSYEALFRYYISGVVQNRDNINRLVLTYPNTYTPRHIGTLRNLVKAAFPSVRMLEFVSESDAVAAYYLKHWNDYAVADADFDGNEKILVYDMGAGTLDISYIDKHKDRSGHLTMEIKGKLGTTLAGNYLDFVLAQIVAELCDLDKNVATTRPAIDEDESNERTKLKLFVKNEVKVKLKEANKDLKLKYNGVEFPIGEVLEHKLFNNYLDVCTKCILTQLVHYMESDGKLPIDTVLLSGRSCLLEPLQKRLQENVNAITNHQPRFVILDKPSRNLDGNSERQKTAVAEGAMEIANNYRRANSEIHVMSRRHYASFGLAYEIPGGKKVYRQILNHSDLPNSASLDDYMSDSIRIDHLNNVNQLVLIQTYLSESDTEEALNRGDYQFISEMEVIDTQALGSPSTVEPKLRIDRMNDIIVYFGTQRTPGHQPLGEDLQSEETRRSIWPFTVENN